MTLERTSTVRREWSLAMLAAGLAWLAWLVGATDPIERPLFDLLLRVPRPGTPAATDIAAVVIDDASVESLGPLPWPRARLARLIDEIRKAGARAVVLDILLPEQGDADGDEAVARSLLSGPSLLAAVLSPEGSWLLPLDRFGGARRAAHGHAEIANDGVVRSVLTTKQSGGVSLPALAIGAARLAGWQGVVVPGTPLRPDFRRPPNEVPRVSAAALLDGRADATLLAGKVVLVGVTAAGAGDQFVVPVGSRGRPDPGVLVHAAAADALLRGGLLRSAPAWLVAAVLLPVCLLAQWARSRRGRLGAAYLAGIAALVVVVTLAGLWTSDIQLPLATLLGGVVLSAAGREILESAEVQRETATVLAALIDRKGIDGDSKLPRGVAGRLQLAHTLQQQIVRDRDLRRTLLEGLDEGVALWDEDGGILLGNAALAELWGSQPSLDEVVSEADPPGPSETIERQRFGRSLSIQLRPLPVGTLGLIRDVSAVRELERRRRETQRLVSHELKTPLASISGFGAMLERYELDREEQLRVAGMIRGEADRLGKMVATFLDLERLGSGRFEADRRRVDMAALVRQRCELLAAAAAERLQLLRTTGRSSAPILGSEELLARLVDNLVGNALKYSPPGAPVDVTVERRTDRVAVEVRDRGAGIPEDAIPHLFERFFRVPGAEQPGTGLGLALVREIADWHGAEVNVDSELGQGSTFTVTFPAATERSDADAGDRAGS